MQHHLHLSSLNFYLAKVKEQVQKKTKRLKNKVETKQTEMEGLQLQSININVDRLSLANKQQHFLGLEFLEDIHTQNDLIQCIIKHQFYIKEYYMQTQEYLIDFHQVFKNVSISDQRNLGSIVGFVILSFVGFFALEQNYLGILVGAIVGILLGRFIGKRIKQQLKMYSQNKVEFDIFKIKMLCYLKWAKVNSLKYQWDINQKRFYIEKMLLEIKPALHYRQFPTRQQKQIKAVLQKIIAFMKKESILPSLQLTCLLCQEYLKILKKMTRNDPARANIEINLLQGIDNVLKPVTFLLNEFKQKNCQSFQLKYEIDQFLLLPEIILITNQYPDPQMSLEFIKLFAEKMKVPVRTKDLQIYLEDKNYKDLENIGQLIYEQQQRRERQETQLFDISKDEFNVGVGENIEKPNQIQFSFSEIINEIPEARISERNSSLQKELPESSINANSIKELENNSSQGFQVSIKQHPNNAMLIEVFSQKKEEQKIVSSNAINQFKNEFTEKKFQLFVSILNEPEQNWESVVKKDNIFIYKTMKPGNDSVFVKGYAILKDVEKYIALKAIQDGEFRASWDKILKGFRVVCQENELEDVIFYYAVSPIPMIAPREWLQRRIVRYDYPNENQISVVCFSVEHELQPVIKGHIRAETDASGFVFEDIEGGCKISFVSNNDIKGKIPKALVNYASAKAPFQWFENLRKACLQYKKFNHESNIEKFQ